MLVAGGLGVCGNVMKFLIYCYLDVLRFSSSHVNLISVACKATRPMIPKLKQNHELQICFL
jgi:hypothetical protein